MSQNFRVELNLGCLITAVVVIVIIVVVVIVSRSTTIVVGIVTSIAISLNCSICAAFLVWVVSIEKEVWSSWCTATFWISWSTAGDTFLFWVPSSLGVEHVVVISVDRWGGNVFPSEHSVAFTESTFAGSFIVSTHGFTVLGDSHSVLMEFTQTGFTVIHSSAFQAIFVSLACGIQFIDSFTLT